MVRFLFNPFTKKLDIASMGIGPQIEMLTGNSGGPVGPDSMFNLDLFGDNSSGINTVGDPLTFTMTIFGLPSSTTQIGTTRFATHAESAAQTLATIALTPDDITSMFSTHPLPASQGGTGLSSPAAHSLVVTNGSSPFTLLGIGSNGEIPIGSIGGDPVLANITSMDGSITITNGPGSIDLAGSSGINWSVISASQTLVVDEGYICASPAGALTLLLPAVSSVGDQLEVTLSGATSWSITQSAGQQIKIGNLSSTAGGGGSLTSTQQGDSIRMVCSVANLTWIVLSSMGNPTLV